MIVPVVEGTTEARGNRPVLQLGAVGFEVSYLQGLLVYWGTYRGCLNGIFDACLEKAIREFQSRMFLAETGTVDSLTWQALYAGGPVHLPSIAYGDAGAAVQILQKALRSGGYDRLEPHGRFARLTDEAVKDFQRRQGLAMDGIVGIHTWRSLSRMAH